MVQNISLIWLDNNIDEDAPDYQNIISQLQKNVNLIHTFTDSQMFIEFLENIGDDKACVIISESLAEQIVSKIHDLAQIDTIFIFGDNKRFHETWTKNWFKVKGIFTEITSIPMSIINTNGTITKNRLEPRFMYTTILKEILLTIKFEKRHIKEYVEYCRNVYAGNYTQFRKISKFERKYNQNESIRWYTSNCFLYQMLNDALRKIDGHVITKMGFFIADLHRQIEALHKEQFGTSQSNSEFIVYRGQRITEQELDKIRQNIGGLLSFSSFLSTSKTRDVALAYAPTGHKNSQDIGIIFVMTIQPDKSTIPFASIAHISKFGIVENEVLFAMNSIFRINDIQPMSDHPNCFTVHLSLTADTDRDLNVLTDHIRNESSSNETGFSRLASILVNAGQYENAQQIYEMLLRQQTVENQKALLYFGLGYTHYFLGEYDKAISFYEKTLEIQERLLPFNHTDLANSYSNIGLVLYKMGEYDKSLSNLEKALRIREESLPSNHLDIANSYNNIGLVTDQMGEYDKALASFKISLQIREHELPSTHHLLSNSYHNIGLVYFHMDEYDTALTYYKKSLTIRDQSLPSNHPYWGLSYHNIGLAYSKMGEYDKALSSYRKSFTIKKQSLPPKHPELARFYKDISEVYLNMGDYQSALYICAEALHIHQESLSPNHPDLASTYHNMGLIYEKLENFADAYTFCEKAVNIAQTSLSEKHPNLKKYKDNFGRIRIACQRNPWRIKRMECELVFEACEAR